MLLFNFVVYCIVSTIVVAFEINIYQSIYLNQTLICQCKAHWFTTNEKKNRKTIEITVKHIALFKINRLCNIRIIQLNSRACTEYASIYRSILEVSGMDWLNV